MTPLTAVLLLVLSTGPQTEAHYPGASDVFHCRFESSHDEDLYGWPPGWTRRHGPGFPRYVHVRVDENHPPSGGNSLRVDLNGGAATAYGPTVPVNSDVQYVLEGYVQTSGLHNDGAYLSLIFLDSTRTRLSSVLSEKVNGTSAWQKICLGPVSPPAGSSLMLVGLHVEPQGETQDLCGTVSFGGLWLGQLPRIVLTADHGYMVPAAGEIPAEREKPGRNWSDGKRLPWSSFNDVTFLVFPRGQPLEIACVVSGFAAPVSEIRLELLAFDGRTLAEHRQSSSLSQPDEAKKPKPSPLTHMTWRLPGDAVGFYRVRATVVPVAPSVSPSPRAAGTAAETARQAELSLAIIEPQVLPPGSEFGWSLGPNDADMGLAPLGDLLCQCGIRWVKFPFAIKETAVPPVEDGSQGKIKKNENLFQASDRLPKKAPSETVLETSSKSKESGASSLEPLISFSDRLGMAGIHLAGVLQPPGTRLRVASGCPAASDAGKTPADLLAIEAFAGDPKLWYPSIEPLLARLAVEIRFWQVGADRDPGWIGCRDLPGIVSRTKAELDRIGQDLDIGIAWNFAAPLPMATPSSKADRSSSGKAQSLLAAASDRRKTPWRFLSFVCDETTGNDALARRLDSTKSADVARWIVLDALPREGHAVRDRITQLVQRMLIAKMHGAEAIFVATPFDPERGLVNRNGSPSELFLPWRTTALMLGAGPYVGDIDLPQGNRIHCFGGGEKYIGVFLGDKPGEETVYLGTELRMNDLWGNSQACPPTIPGNDEPVRQSSAPGKADFRPVGSALGAPRSVIAAGQLPTFLVGLDAAITQWQLGVAFSPNRLPSVPSALVPVTLELKNTFSQSIAGRIRIHGPQNWYIEPQTAEFRLAAGAPWKQRLEVALPNDVVGGRQMVRLDFEIQADRLYRFTMYRPLEVTLGDVTFDAQTTISNHGDMEVRQTLGNQGKNAVGFRCDLLVPDRRRQSTDVLIQPSGKSELTYRLPDGEQLLGKAIWLRAEEIDGPRVLNYRVETPATANATAVP